MTKRYDEPIEVMVDPIERRAPLGFVWRGRHYDIDQHLSSWADASWNGSRRARDREYVRVLARPHAITATGDLDPDGFMRPVGAVYDIYRCNGCWRLARVWD